MPYHLSMKGGASHDRITYPALLLLLLIFDQSALRAQYSAEALTQKKASDLYDEWGYRQGKALSIDGKLSVSNSTGSVTYTYPISSHPIKGHSLTVELNYCGSVAFTAFKDYHYTSEWEPFQGWNRFTQNRPAWILGVNGFAIQAIATSWDFACDRATVDDWCRKDYDDSKLVWAVDGYDFCNRMEDFGAANYSGSSAFVDVIRLLRADGSVLELRNSNGQVAGMDAHQRDELYTGHYFIHSPNAKGFALVEFDESIWPAHLKTEYQSAGDHVKPRRVRYYPGDGLEYIFKEWLTPFGTRAYYDDRSILRYPSGPRNPTPFNNPLEAMVLGGHIAGPTVFYLERINSSEGLLTEFRRTRHYYGTHPDSSWADETRGRAQITDFSGHRISWGDGFATIEALGRTIWLQYRKTLWSGTDIKDEGDPCPLGTFDRNDAFQYKLRQNWTPANISRSAVGYITEINDLDEVTNTPRKTRFNYEPYKRIYQAFGFPHSGGQEHCPTTWSMSDIQMELKNFRLKEVIEPTQRFTLCYYNGKPEIQGASATNCVPTDAETVSGNTADVNQRMQHPYWRHNIVYKVEKYSRDATPVLLKTDTYTNFNFPYDVRYGHYSSIADYSKQTTTDNIKNTTTTSAFEFLSNALPKLNLTPSYIHHAYFTELKKTTVTDGITTTTTEITYTNPNQSYLWLPSVQKISVQQAPQPNPVMKSHKEYSYDVTTVRTYDNNNTFAAKFGLEPLKAIERTYRAGTNQLLRVDTVVYQHYPLATLGIRRDTMWSEYFSRINHSTSNSTQSFEEAAFLPGIVAAKVETPTNVLVPPQFGLLKEKHTVLVDALLGTWEYVNGIVTKREDQVYNMTSLAPRGGILCDSVIGKNRAAGFRLQTLDYTRWWGKNLPAKARSANGGITESFYDFLLPDLKRADETYQSLSGYMLRNNDLKKAMAFENGEYYAHMYEQPMVHRSLVRKYAPGNLLYTDTLTTSTKLGHYALPTYQMDPNGWVTRFDYDNIGRLLTAWFPYDFPRPVSITGQSYTGEETIEMHAVTKRTFKADTIECLSGGTANFIPGPRLMTETGGAFYARAVRTVIPKCPCDNGVATCKQPYIREEGHIGYLDYDIGTNDPIDAATDLTEAYLLLYVSALSAPSGCVTLVIESPELGIRVPYILGGCDRRLDDITRVNNIAEKEKSATIQTGDDGKKGYYIKVNLMPAKQKILALAPGNSLHFTVKMATADGYVNLTSTAVDSRPRLVLKGTFNTELEKVNERDDYTLAYDHDDYYMTSEIFAKIDDKFHSSNRSPDLTGLGIRRTSTKNIFGPDRKIKQTEIKAWDRNRAPRTDVISYEYNGNNQLVKATAQDGVIIKDDFDAFGRPLVHINGDNTTSSISYATGAQTDFVPYTSGQDFYGFCTRVITTDENNIKTARFYDAFDSLRRIVVDYGGMDITTQYQYNKVGQLIYMVDPNGSQIVYEYDDIGRVKSRRQGDIGTVSYTYDKGGNVRFSQTQEQAQNGALTFQEYDDLDRVTVIGEATISDLPEDPNVRLTDVLDATVLHDDATSGILTANATLWQDPLALVPTFWLPNLLSGETNCYFAASPELLEQSVPEPPFLVHPTQFYVPITGDASTVDFEHLARYPHFIRMAINYDTLPPQSGPVWSSFPSEIDWDSLAPTGKVRNQKGRQGAVAYRTHGGEPFHYLVMSYDERGRIEALLRYTENLGFDAVYYTFNSMNQVISIRTVDPTRQHTTWYGADDNGRIDSVWTKLSDVGQGLSPEPIPGTMTLDLASMRHPAKPVRTDDPDIVYNYTKIGQIDTMWYPPVQTVVDYGYQPKRRWLDTIYAKQAPLWGNPPVEFKEALDHDPVGQVEMQTYNQYNQPQKTQTYSYDQAYRLTFLNGAGVMTNYTYDDMGNRTSLTSWAAPFTTVNYAYGAAGGPNRLAGSGTQVNGVAFESQSFTYEPDGAVTGITTRNANNVVTQTENLEYDYRNLNQGYSRLFPNGDYYQFRYRYNPGGEREQRRMYASNISDANTDYTWTYYLLGADNRQHALYNGRQTSAALCNNGPGRRVYIYPVEYRTYGNGDVANMVTRADGWKRFIVTDHLGSVRLTLNQAGFEGSYNYKPYGETVAPINGARTRMEFIGKEEDVESSFSNFGVRSYSERDGRFLSVDPLWETIPSMSPYHYAEGNPVLLADPSGKTVEITGPDAGTVLSDIQKDLKGITVTLDPATNRLVGSGTAANPGEQKLLDAINDPNRHVILATTNSSTIPGTAGGIQNLMLTGAYDGSVSNPDGSVTATNYIHRENTRRWNLLGGSSIGLSAIHEINEAYVGAILFPGQPHSSSNFNTAHQEVVSKYDLVKDTYMSNSDGSLKDYPGWEYRGLINKQTGKIIFLWLINPSTGQISQPNDKIY